MAGLLETLIRPDSEEDPEQSLIARAANILEVGEIQLLQLAYREWFGEDISEPAIDSLFKSCMMNGEVPFWARRYARKIIELDDAGRLDDRDPRYHRYDCEYRAKTPLDARSIGMALGFAAMIVVGGLAISEFEADPSTSMFPPYLSDTELRR